MSNDVLQTSICPAPSKSPLFRQVRFAHLNQVQQPGAVIGLGQVIANDVGIICINLGKEDKSRNLCMQATIYVNNAIIKYVSGHSNTTLLL